MGVVEPVACVICCLAFASLVLPLGDFVPPLEDLATHLEDVLPPLEDCVPCFEDVTPPAEDPVDASFLSTFGFFFGGGPFVSHTPAVGGSG